MKKLILACASVVSLMALAACSDSADTTTTQSTTPPPAEQTQPAPQAPANDAMKPAEPAPAQ